MIDAGGDRVVAFCHELARGTQSAVVGTDTAAIYTVKAGSVVGVDAYMDRDQALEAAGLSD